MITFVEGNRYTETKTAGPFRKLSLTLTLKPHIEWDTPPTTITFTGTWEYGTGFFETTTVSQALYTDGPRRYL